MLAGQGGHRGSAVQLALASAVQGTAESTMEDWKGAQYSECTAYASEAILRHSTPCQGRVGDHFFCWHYEVEVVWQGGALGFELGVAITDLLGEGGQVRAIQNRQHP